jgi:hypothetical protein
MEGFVMNMEIEFPGGLQVAARWQGEGFPERYRAAILRAVDHCAVKRHVLEPPLFTVAASAAGPSTAAQLPEAAAARRAASR